MKKKLKVVLIVFVSIVLSLVILSSVGGSMTELNHQIKVNAPRDQIFSVLADLEAVQHYNPTVLDAKYITSNRTGIGAARECDLGKDGKVQERVIEYKENEYIAMELSKHSWPLEFMKWTTSVKTDSQGSFINQNLQYKMKFGLIGSLLDKLFMKKKLDTTLNSVFKSMKSYIENGKSA